MRVPKQMEWKLLAFEVQVSVPRGLPLELVVLSLFRPPLIGLIHRSRLLPPGCQIHYRLLLFVGFFLESLYPMLPEWPRVSDIVLAY